MYQVFLGGKRNESIVGLNSVGNRLFAVLLILVMGLSSYVMAGPPYYSVDPNSPVVTDYGQSPSDLFDPDTWYGDDTPPPAGMCRSREDFGVAEGDNIDAISLPGAFLNDAVGAYLVDDVNYAANIYFWSVDRESVGRTGGDILAGGAAGDGVPSGGKPVYEETTEDGDSACGDVYWQLWDGEPPSTVRMNLLYIEEYDIEEQGGSFGDPNLDELDALEMMRCGEAEEYYFSFDNATAATRGVNGASILRYDADLELWSEVLSPNDLGLDPNDDIDAMQIMTTDNLVSFAIAFSLAPNSPSLTDPCLMPWLVTDPCFSWSAADIFLVDRFTPYPGYNTPGDVNDHHCWMHAEYLSLLPTDNLDALVVAVGDPGEKGCSSGPSPGDEEKGVSPNVEVCWVPGAWAARHEIYWGDDPCNLLLVSVQTADCYTPPEPLDYCTTYYWQVVEANDLHPDSPWEGDVWSYTTASSLPGDIDGNVVVNWGDLSCVAGYWLASGPDDDGPNGIPDECDSYASDIAPDGGDGIVNFLDYAVVAGHWLEEADDGCPCDELNFDIDTNGIVSVSDVVMLTGCITGGTCPEGTDYDCSGATDQDDLDFLVLVVQCLGMSGGSVEDAITCCESLR